MSGSHGVDPPGSNSGASAIKRRQHAYLFVTVATAAVVGVFVGARGISRPGAFATFGAIAIVGEMARVRLPMGTSTSPVIVPVLAGAYVLGDAGTYLPAAFIGAAGGLHLVDLARRRWTPVAFNAAAFLLSASAAAAVFGAFDPAGAGSPLRFVIATVPAGLVFLTVNMALLVPMVAMHTGRAPAELIREMQPFHLHHASLPLIGSALGWMYVEMGPAVVVLSITPILVARFSFVAFLGLREAQEGAVDTLLRALERKDPYTAGHVRRVAAYADEVAQELGLSQTQQSRLRQAAFLHDLGKLAVPSRLLNKPGRLTAEEYERVKLHDWISLEVLRRVGFLESAASAVPPHSGFAPANPSVEAGIIAVVDAYDAMTSSRSYRLALARQVAVDELRKGIGTQFDPACVDAFLRVLERRQEPSTSADVDLDRFAAPPSLGPGSAGLGDLAPTPGAPERGQGGRGP